MQLRFFNPFTKVWRFFMTVESKLDALLAGQAALLTAIQNQPGTNLQAVLDGQAAIKTELDSVSATIGTETPSPTPSPTPAPTPAP